MKGTRPNIIFLLTDDQRFNTLGCMGNSEIKTPNIDQLGNEGIVFDSHYNTTSICMAARACVMTGMYEHKTGCNFQHGGLSQALFNRSYPALLRNAGYYTGFAGKFGFGVHPENPAPSSWHKKEDMPDDQFDWWAGFHGQGNYATKENTHLKKYAKEYPHLSRALGAAGQDFIKGAAKKGNPFCLSISFKAPHNPVKPDPELDHLYEGATFTKPANYGREAGEHFPPQAKSGRQYQKLFNKWNPERYDEAMAKYYQQISGIDAAIGMLREELERQGVADNTVIMYATDNGYSCGAHGLGGKVLPYEEASRSPFILYDPRHSSSGKGHRCGAVTANIDVAPTILELAGLSIPSNMDGISLLPLLDNPQKDIRNSLSFTQVWGPYSNHSLTVITPEWKYIYWNYGGSGMTPSEELYNMRMDRLEMHNESHNSDYKDDLEKMRELYDQHLQRWKDDCIRAHRYPGHAILADRHIPWSEKAHLVPRKKRGENEDNNDA